jgi:hypothetical protein
MIDIIDELYKQSAYKKISFVFSVVFLLAFIIIGILNYFKLYIPMIVISILSVLLIKFWCGKILNTKLKFNIKKEGEKINAIIKRKDKELFLKFLKDNNIYSESKINSITSHYRSLIKSSGVEDVVWNILNLAISLIPMFITQDGVGNTTYKVAIPYLVVVVVFLLSLYWLIKMIPEIKVIIRRKNTMYERLELIFTELYLEYKENSSFKKRKSLLSILSKSK